MGPTMYLTFDGKSDYSIGNLNEGLKSWRDHLLNSLEVSIPILKDSCCQVPPYLDIRARKTDMNIAGH